MGLTKQHFEAIAEILRSEVYLDDAYKKDRSISKEMIEENHETVLRIVDKLISYFKTQNPQFEEARFKEACLK